MTDEGVPYRPSMGGRAALKLDELDAELALLEEARDAVGGPNVTIAGGGNIELGIRHALAVKDPVDLAWSLVERERQRVEKRRDLVARSIEAREWFEWRVVHRLRRFVRTALRN
jgi:hypothetical protein